ncbi:MAG: Spy/CpxP family protein refolding chaperone [Deltaproteobacteria bacterium]|nr:MAG: Spy/CpxP family protein refolding chaperone [Deltaproteobacteria bacterium]
MNNLRSITTSVSILLVGMLFLAACHPRHSHNFYGPSKFRSPQKRIAWLKEEIADRLELDDTQKARLDRITADLIDSGKEMHAVRASIRDTVISEFRKDEINKENLTQVFSENRVKFEDMISMFADRLVEFHQMLTPEQRTKLLAEIEKHQRWKRGYHMHW